VIVKKKEPTGGGNSKRRLSTFWGYLEVDGNIVCKMANGRKVEGVTKKEVSRLTERRKNARRDWTMGGTVTEDWENILIRG